MLQMGRRGLYFDLAVSRLMPGSDRVISLELI
jgi:hypothetical protein